MSISESQSALWWAPTQTTEVMEDEEVCSKRSREGGNTIHSPSLNPAKRPKVNPAKKWCFTLHYEECSSVPMIQLSQHWNLAKMIAQEEQCPQTQRLHVQGVLEFKEKSRPLTHFKDLGAHWEVCKDWCASIEYCRKSETKLLNGRTWVIGVEDLVPQVRTVQPKGWQKDLIDQIPTFLTRKIYWFWEPLGNKGKSEIVKWLVIHRKAMVMSGKGADIKNVIIKMKVKPTMVILDIPRSSQGCVSYTALEEVSNGIFFSGKYEGGMCVFDAPIMLVFANEEPNKDKMSQDRWEVRDLSYEANPKDL